MAIAGLAVAMLGAVVLILSVPAGLVLIVLGLLALMLAPGLVLFGFLPVKPRAGERRPVKYGATLLGTTLRAVDPKHGHLDEK